MNFVKKAVLKASKKARQERAAIFHRYFRVDENTKILDLGSEDGSNIAALLAGTAVNPKNVFIADIAVEPLERGRQNFGFNPVLLDESGGMPFADNFFDLVYCSSVIEHTTVPKKAVWDKKIDFEFIAAANQKNFAAAIRRVGRGYFVQTPAKSFPLESHSWLPFIGYLPRSMKISILAIANRFWVKQTIPDFRLLHKAQFSELFPDAEIINEKSFGMVKSLIAIKANLTAETRR